MISSHEKMEGMGTDTDAAGMAILEKAGAVIDALEAHGETSASGIAETVGEPVSSTYRLLSSLTELGWVDPGSRRGLYRLGLRVVRIGGMLEERIDVRRACEPFLEELRDRTRCTSFLCYRRGSSAVCVDRIGGHDVQSLAMKVGDSFELYRGAAPLAILAFLPPEEQGAILSGFDARRAGGEDLPDAAEIVHKIERTRADGFSTSDEDVTPGIAAIGAPIFNHRGELEGSVSLSGLRERILGEGAGTAEQVLAAARRSSAALGYRHEEAIA